MAIAILRLHLTMISIYTSREETPSVASGCGESGGAPGTVLEPAAEDGWRYVGAVLLFPVVSG
jgi:hypothetical protein